MRIATIYDTTMRPDTVGVYVTKALRGLGHEVSHIEPLRCSRTPDGFDLYFVVDDGIPYCFSDPHKNIAYWAVDTHISMANQVLKSEHAKWVFAAQKNGAAELAKTIKKPVEWLPLACDESHVRDPEPLKSYDVCFIGNVYPSIMPKRVAVLDEALAATERFVYGQKPPRATSDIYAKSRIVLNCAIRDDVNMRVFEAMASGSMLLTDNCGNGLDDLFKAGEHLAVYDGNVANVIQHYIINNAERERIAAQGKECVLTHHTYRERMKTAIERIKESI